MEKAQLSVREVQRWTFTSIQRRAATDRREKGGREGEHSGQEETREEERREKRESVGEREGREKKGCIER